MLDSYPWHLNQGVIIDVHVLNGTNDEGALDSLSNDVRVKSIAKINGHQSPNVRLICDFHVSYA